MIVYHPVKDVHHCVFRLLCLLNDIEHSKIPVETLQILDFYLLFPSLIKKMKIPRNTFLSSQKAKSIPDPYEYLPNPQMLFVQLKNIQGIVLKQLVSKGFLEKEAFDSGEVALIRKSIPNELLIAFSESPKRKGLWYRFLVSFLANFQIYGKDGLKDRSGLMEYRYDPK